MTDLNRATLMGRLGGDPDIRATKSGDKIANFSVATAEQWKDGKTGEKKERTQWHRVVVWGNLAGVCEKYLKKGSRVYIEGEIRTRKYQDQSGQDVFITEIVVSGFGAKVVIIDWPDADEAPRSQDDARHQDSLPAPSSRVLDDEIPF